MVLFGVRRRSGEEREAGRAETAPGERLSPGAEIVPAGKFVHGEESEPGAGLSPGAAAAPSLRAGFAGLVRRMVPAAAAVILFPYIVTLAWNGSIGGQPRPETVSSGKRVYLEETGGYVDAEEYLAGVVARQIPMDYELEAVKAQAVIARTWLYRHMDGEERVSESELDLDFLEEADIEKLWGEEHFLEYYEKLCRAVNETAGRVILWDGRLIEPLFHRASAGRTRDGDEAHPYLAAADSSFDTEAEGYLSVNEWTAEEFAARMSGAAESGGERGVAGSGSGSGVRDAAGTGGGLEGMSADQILDTVQVVSRDGSGYVAEIQIGSHVYTGEQVREALGLASGAFSIKGHEGKIQAVCEGIGHGLGLSQYGASRLAAGGWTCEEILQYYYKGVTIR